MAQMLREEFAYAADQGGRCAGVPILKRFKARIDPSQHNGATCLGCVAS